MFRRAREESPSVLFIDEIDALVVARNLAGGGGGGFSGLNERMLTTLLSEMDGVDKNEQVIFLAATNNISSLDKVCTLVKKKQPALPRTLFMVVKCEPSNDLMFFDVGTPQTGTH